MDLILLLHAIVLGVVEGLTEFLPVSSTGHLIIVGDLLGFVGERAKTFEIFIQLGSILGVVWLYRRKIFNVVGHLHQAEPRRLATNVMVAFLPAAIIGLLAHDTIKTYLFSPITVAIALIVGGIIILWVENRQNASPRVASVEDMTVLDAFKVGCAQTVAMIPGVSRSGATIIGGMLTGLSRTAATEFSFFLAMPTMLAATLYDLFKSLPLLTLADIPLFGVGFMTAFVTAMIVVKLFLGFVAHHDFKIFAYYRIIFGAAVLLYFAE